MNDNTPLTKKEILPSRPPFYFKPEEIPVGAKVIKVLDVDYVHVRTRDGGDLYVTRYGLPFISILWPDRWYFSEQARQTLWEKLPGTGTVHRVNLKKAHQAPIDVVIKWSRIGQDVPGRNPDTLDDYDTGEFNSPFEEFSSLMEMRDSCYESPGRIRTHKPLAIFVPAERIDPDSLGRKEYRFNTRDKDVDIELDLHRQYLLMYEWVKGVDAVEARKVLGYPMEFLKTITLNVEQELIAKGFQDSDRKPNHIIVRTNKGALVEDSKRKKPLYAYIDFEMLRRTPQREKMVIESKRAAYLTRQRDRFLPHNPVSLPPHLHLVNILGVDYIYGTVESTGGALWVVGRDPSLFDYFLPERWRRTPRTKISHTHEAYRTTTKDGIHLVWKVSKVGEKPVFFEQTDANKRIMSFGYNSPFEEYALAIELSRQGLPTNYPRAIYRTGYQALTSDYMADNQRYETHKDIVMPDGTPVLQKEYHYMEIWGYWNGPDELLAVRDGEFYSGINMLHARNEGIISQEVFKEVLEKEQQRFAHAGIEDLYLRAEDFNIALDPKGHLVLDSDGKPELRCTSFEFMKRLT